MAWQARCARDCGTRQGWPNVCALFAQNFVLPFLALPFLFVSFDRLGLPISSNCESPPLSQMSRTDQIRDYYNSRVFGRTVTIAHAFESLDRPPPSSILYGVIKGVCLNVFLVPSIHPSIPS